MAIYTHEDLGPLAEPLPLVVDDPGLHHPRTQRPLARDEVHLVGEPIALVVATTRAAAEDAAEHIRVEYESRPAVASLSAAVAAEALVHHDVPGNIAGEVNMETGDPDVALEQ